MKVLVVLALSALAAGCTASRAQTHVERPALDVPPVPARMIDPAPPPDPPMPQPVPDLPEVEKVTVPLPKPRASSPKEITRETAKPEQQKTDIAPVEPPSSAAPAAAPAVRTNSTMDGAAIRESLGRTQAMLGGIDYNQLSKERQTSYNHAKNHVEGAETALKRQDLDLAKELAEKAEKLARGLQTR